MGCRREYAGRGNLNKFKKILGGKGREKIFKKYRKLKKVHEKNEVWECGARHKQKYRWQKNRNGAKSHMG